MKHRIRFTLAVLSLVILTLVNPLPAQAMQVAPGANFTVNFSFDTQGVPITGLRVVFNWTEGLTFNSGTSSNMGGMSSEDMGGVTVGHFAATTAVTQGVVTLRFTAGTGVEVGQAVMVEGVTGADANGDPVQTGGGGRTEVLVSTDGETWPEEWTVETPATYETEGLEYRTSSLGRKETRAIPVMVPVWSE